MIKFFRKIRQKLLSENKFSKYLLYAIGEIVLVVIGILIALSINNWNEQRKVNEFEKELLISLRNSIVEDLHAQERAIRWNEGIQLSCEILLKHIDENLLYHDSLNYYFARATTVTSFPITDSEYRNAESYGLQIFRDEDTRNQLIRIYGRHIPMFNNMLEQESQYYNNIAVPLYTELFMSSSKGGFGQEVEMIPNNYNILIKNSKYRNILNTNMKNRGREHYEMKYILDILMEVINLLEKEIQTR